MKRLNISIQLNISETQGRKLFCLKKDLQPIITEMLY